MNPIISVENLSKQYRIGTKLPYKTFRETIMNVVTSPARLFRGNGSRENNTIWALKDVSFEVQQGEILGIIGRNGAGKTTLLKILSRVTEPTEGEVRIRGRVGSLLEVGTGFHPELTGRENIFLNGAILGMRREEIKKKFDEIVAFSEVEKFLDTPVKRYSSGMYVRLAFAVAAHLEPEILLVDEVLAVGDVQFQKKCLGKMGDVAKEGRTVLFVSHNMGAVQRLCTRCTWLYEGMIKAQGLVSKVITNYISDGLSNEAERRWPPSEALGDDSFRLNLVRISQLPGIPNSRIDITKPFEVQIETEAFEDISELNITLQVLSSDGQIILHTMDIFNSDKATRERGRLLSVCRFPAYTLNAGNYVLSVCADIPHVRVIFLAESILGWDVENISPETGRYDPGAWKGFIGPGLPEWSEHKVD
jgi:lipopolysaccharide transport system ATP-binding protein